MKFKSIISLLAILLISQCESTMMKALDFSQFDRELFDALKEPVTHRPLILEDDEDDKKELEIETNTLRPIFDTDDEFEGQPTTKDVQEDVDKVTESSTMLKSDNIPKDLNDLVDENKLNPSVILVDNENLPVPLPLPSSTPFVAPVDDGIEKLPKVTPVDNKSESKLTDTYVDDEKTPNHSIVPVDDRKEPQPSVTSTDDASKSKSSVTSVNDEKKPDPSIVLVDDDKEMAPKSTPVDDESESKLLVTSGDDENTLSTLSIVPVDDDKEVSSKFTPVDDLTKLHPSVTPTDNENKPIPSTTPVDNESKSKSPVLSKNNVIESKSATIPKNDDVTTQSPDAPIDNKKYRPHRVAVINNKGEVEFTNFLSDKTNIPIPSTSPVDNENESKSPVLSKNNVIESESATIPKNDDVTTQSPDAPNDKNKHRSHQVAVFTKEDEIKYINPLSDKFKIRLVDIFKSDFTQPKNNDDNKPKPRLAEPKPTSLDNYDNKPTVTVDNEDRKPDSEIPPYAKYNVDLLDHNKHGPFKPIPPVISAFPPIPPTFSRIPAIPQIPHIFIPRIPPVYIPRPPTFQIPQFPPHFPFAGNNPALNHRTGHFNIHPYYHHPTQQVPYFNNHPYHRYATQQVQSSNNHPYHHFPTQETRNFYNQPSHNYLNNKMGNSYYNPNHPHLQYK